MLLQHDIKKLFFLTLLYVVSMYTHEYVPTHECTADDVEWAIIGAGPAGIVVVGVLLDLGCPADKIVWIDPEFNVGRLGQHYASLPSNTKTKLFVDFIKACKTFQECKSSALDSLFLYDADITYPLSIIVEPLQDITDYLCARVKTCKHMLTALDHSDNTWNVAAESHTFKAKNVVLATGSYPRSLAYEVDTEIPLDIALNKAQLFYNVNEDDTVAVVGSSHSAVLVMKFLSELSTGRIVNFYNKPLQYAIDMGAWTLHNSAGLKGIAAEWAQNVLEKNTIPNIVRFHSSPEILKAWLPICNKIVYAIGYERNQLPPITGVSTPILYDDTTGIIAPHLFGIGIAFPEKYVDPLGNQEHRVGLNSFMSYAQRVIPTWLHTKEGLRDLLSFEDLFMIEML